MVQQTPFHVAVLIALALAGTFVMAGPAQADGEPCVQCLRVRVGPPFVARGPFPDELDATFTALQLADGSLRGFSANGTTYAIDGATLWDMRGPRQAVLQAGAPDSLSECGRWLTTTMRSGSRVLGLVHQERACDYNQGRTNKSMAIATSLDDGLSWMDLQTIITGTDTPQPDRITGEGDCTMIDGADDYLYAYCLRNSDWQTIVARAPTSDPTSWVKFYQGGWSEPGLGGQATAIGFIGPGAGYLRDQGWVATIAVDQWFGGLRLSLSKDKVSFVDLEEPLVTIDGSQWDRPAETDLFAYATILDPDTGSNTVHQRFLLSYIYVPPGKGFESRYLVYQEVTLSVEDKPQTVQVGMALMRWADPENKNYVTSSGPLTGDRLAYARDKVVAYMLTREPEGEQSVKIAECSKAEAGRTDQLLVPDGSCPVDGYIRDRTAGWLYANEQPGTVPVYRCSVADAQTHFASNAPDCEGIGSMDFLLGYGLPS